MRLLAVLAAAALAVCAQQTPGKLTIPFTDPAKPKLVNVSNLTGSIHIQAHSGSDVTVEIKERGSRSEAASTSGGMRRIGSGGGDIRAEELDNKMKIRVGHSNRPVDLVIQVPTNCNLDVNINNDGKLVVDGVQGEISVKNLNGPVTLNNVSGNVLAHSLNGEVKVALDRVDASRPMSFSTLNGDIDVTLPGDIKATVKMKSDNGELMSDFEITQTVTPQVEGGQRDSRGMYRVTVSRAFNGTINGGGQQMQFTTLNGTIYIRKKR